MAQSRSSTHATGTKASGNHHMYPPTDALATPTVLSADQARAVTEAVNPLVADAFALYVKTKNYHWHLSGPRFHDLHLLFDTQAEAILEGIDPLAERLRKIGGNTIHSISQISDLQTIHDDNDAYVTSDQMVRRLMDDNLHIAKKQHEAIDLCEKQGDTVTSNLLQEILDETERRVWFLFEITQGTDVAP